LLPTGLLTSESFNELGCSDESQLTVSNLVREALLLILDGLKFCSEAVDLSLLLS